MPTDRGKPEENTEFNDEVGEVQTEGRDLAETEKTEKDQLLLRQFKFESLYTEHVAGTEIKTDDVNFGMLPEFLEKLLKDDIGLIHTPQPSKHPTTTQQRQRVVDELLAYPHLDDFKDLAVLINKICRHSSEPFIHDVDIRGTFIDICFRENVNPQDRSYAKKMVQEFLSKAQETLAMSANRFLPIETRTDEKQYPFVIRIIKELKSGLETLKNVIEQIRQGNQYQIGEYERILRQIKNMRANLLISIALVELVRQNGYGRAEFDCKRPRKFEGGWHFSCKRENERLNDSVEESPVTIFSGPNMSGKSHTGLQREFAAQWFAQTFGYGPFARGNFPKHYGNLFFLSADSTSHANEIVTLNNLLRHINPDGTFFCADEPFSQTSPQDQNRLIRGIELWILQRSGNIMISTHNEEVISYNRDIPNAQIYYFPVTLDDNESIDFSYKLTRETSQTKPDSYAIHVMRHLGISRELCRHAEQYAEGAVPGPIHVNTRKWPEIKLYTQEEREKMKEQIALPSDLISGQEVNGNHNDQQLITTLNTARHLIVVPQFTSGFGHTYQTSAGNIYRPRYFNIIDHFVKKLYLETTRLSVQETLERQRTFEALGEDPENLRKLLAFTDQIWSFLEKIRFFAVGMKKIAGILKFNHTFNPFEWSNRYHGQWGPKSMEPEWHRAQKGKIPFEIVICFLELNKKILGANFPLNIELDEFRKLHAAFTANGEQPETKLQLEEKSAHISELCKNLPSVSLLDCDLEKIREELVKILKHIISNYFNLDSKFIDATCFATTVMAICSGDNKKMKELVDKLHKVDSVHCHQMGNALQQIFDEATLTISYGKEHKTRSVPLSSVEDILDVLREIYKTAREKADALEKEITPLKQQQTEFIAKYRERLAKVDEKLPEAIRMLAFGRDYFAEIEEQFSAGIKSDDFGLFSEALTSLGKYLQIDDKTMDTYHTKFERIYDRFEHGGNSEEYIIKQIVRLGKLFIKKHLTAEVRHDIDQCIDSTEKFSLAIDTDVEAVLNKKKEQLLESCMRDINIGLHFSVDKMIQEMYAAMAMPQIAQMIVEKGYAKVEFNELGDFNISEGESLLFPDYTPKNVSFPWKQRLKFLRSRNGSGKTEYLNAQLLGLAFAMATGFYPGKSATIPHFNQIAMLHMPSVKKSNDLSSFGEEISRIDTFLQVLSTEDNTFYLLDEPGKTTSPLYQAAIIHALSSILVGHGQIGIMATHNHAPCDALMQNNPLLIHSSRLTWHEKNHANNFKLIDREAGKSEGVEVAEEVGLDKNIMNFIRLLS